MKFKNNMYIKNGVLIKYKGNDKIVNIPKSVNEIGSSAFSIDIKRRQWTLSELQCTIETINIPFCLKSLCNGSENYLWNEPFLMCDSLVNINVEEGNKYFTSIDGILYDKEVSQLVYCPRNYNSKTLNIPNTVIKINDSAYSYNYNLEEIIIPKNIKVLESWVFSCCEKVSKVELNDNIEIIETGVFNNCINITSITIPAKVKTLYATFMGCFNLEKVVLPNELEELFGDVFINCCNLNTIILPPNLKKIGTQTFNNCEKLEKIVIPRSVEKVGYEAFVKCESLTIFCEVEEKPNEWDEKWNIDNRPVIWGYKN